MTAESIDDKTLILKIAAGDMAALETLAQRHQLQILALAYRILGDWDMAEDVVQETFLRLIKASKKYEPDARLTTWLYRVVVNLCIDHQRKSRTMSLPLEKIVDHLPAQDSDDSIEKMELATIVQNAVSGLPDRQRVALILHRYDGLSHSEISAITGWSTSAVESLLVRAYRNLRDKLKKNKYLLE